MTRLRLTHLGRSTYSAHIGVRNTPPCWSRNVTTRHEPRNLLAFQVRQLCNIPTFQLDIPNPIRFLIPNTARYLSQLLWLRPESLIRIWINSYFCFDESFFLHTFTISISSLRNWVYLSNDVITSRPLIGIAIKFSSNVKRNWGSWRNKWELRFGENGRCWQKLFF